jgi:hypothetical protein
MFIKNKKLKIKFLIQILVDFLTSFEIFFFLFRPIREVLNSGILIDVNDES